MLLLSILIRSVRNYALWEIWWCFLICAVLMVPVRIFTQGSAAPAPDQKEVVDFLNKTIDWYQDRTAQQRIATEPGDAFFFDNNRPIADQIVHLSFDFARAKAELIGNNQGSTQVPPPTADPAYRNLTETATRLETQMAQMRSQLEEQKKTLPRLPRSQRKGAESAIGGLQSQLDLLRTQQETARTILQFIGGTSGPVSLTSQIDALEHTIPQNQAPLSGSANGAEATAANRVRPGLWGVLSRLFDLLRKAQTVKNAIRETSQLSECVKQMQVPLRKQALDLTHQSQSAGTSQNPQDPAVLAAQKSALDAANKRLKLLAAAFLPLRKQTVLLEAYQKNLENWLAAIRSDQSSELKDLLLRLLGLGLLLGIVLSLFDVWRRAIVRYVSDLGKRYQFMVMRRIALVAAVTLIIVLTFLNALGSLATFAGLMTAGVAVALQNVFLAIVGYFMLIGKFGVRVGDRVQIGETKGRVVEIGMLRLHLLEIAAMDADPQPTGRLVAVSNSVVFQPTVGFIKQVPGSTLIWREINFTVAPESDFRTVEQRTYSAVDTAFKEYQGDLERMRSRMERELKSVSIGSLEPSVRFGITPAGIEVHLRFPADQQRAAEIDDRVTRELVRAMAAEPKLRVVEAEGSGLRQRTDGGSNEVKHPTR
jgi:small-conductance mechanosensitive channel